MTNCIFCQIADGKAPSWKVMEDAYTYAFLDINPVSEYHTLVIPRGHHTNMFDVPSSVAGQVMDMVKKVVDMYQAKLDISNLQVVNSNGREAQQDVFHLHYHIIPRSYSDGQNIKWKTHPEWRPRFNDLLAALK